MEHRQFAGAATDIDARTRRIKEHIVGIATRRQSLPDGTGARIQQQKRRRRTEHAGKQRLRRIERHWECGTCLPHRPVRHNAPCVEVNHGDLVSARNVDVGAARLRIDLECFRMSRQSDVSNFRM